MYESFFGFKERPFNLTPNTNYLYLSNQHEGVLKTLLYGIERRVGFMMLSGEVGSGKTTTIRALLNILKDSAETSLILNPLLSPLDLLIAINNDFGNPCESQSVQQQIDSLNQYLLKINENGKPAVVIIDESQNLNFEAFEMTRMLSNLETESQKLLNIIFVGQPELEGKLKNSELRQLAQRIQIHAKIKPLDLHETIHYIKHRLSCSGEKITANFEQDAIKRIYKKSKGIPRLINNICDLSLLAAYSRNTKNISKKIINQAIKEVPSYVNNP